MEDEKNSVLNCSMKIFVARHKRTRRTDEIVVDSFLMYKYGRYFFPIPIK